MYRRWNLGLLLLFCRPTWINFPDYPYKNKQDVGDELGVCVLNILPKARSLPSLLAINLVKVKIQIFQTVTWPHFGHLIKGFCLGVSYTKSTPFLVWCKYIFYRWIYVFYLSRDPTRTFHWDVMHIYGWELLASCYHRERLGGHRHSDSHEEKCFIKNMDLINKYCHWKSELIG